MVGIWGDGHLGSYAMEPSQFPPAGELNEDNVAPVGPKHVCPGAFRTSSGGVW
jgi:hypothetical protein